MATRPRTATPQMARLRNGLRVVATPMRQSRTLSMCLALRAGSIYDPPGAAGIAHFLEHLIFKSTDDYSRHELAETMQRCGNRFDPSTHKELISIAGTVPLDKTEAALDLLASVVQHPKFDPADMEIERRVVLEELRDWEDDPSKRIEVLTDATLWGAHPLGRDVGGTRATVRGISRAQVRRHHRRLFHPRNAVLSLAGPLSARELHAAARSRFGGWRAARGAVMPRPTTRVSSVPSIPLGRRAKVLRRAHTQQVWFSVSTTTPSYPDGYEAVLRTQLLQGMIGDGDGSRLWDGLREQRGLAYEVYATQDFYADVGVMSAMAAVGRGRAHVALREMQRILEGTRHGFSAAEFDRGRESFASQIALYAEWNAEIARRYAELALLDQPLVTPSRELAMLERLRPSEFNDFVKAKVRWEAGAVCAIGEGPALDSIR